MIKASGRFITICQLTICKPSAAANSQAGVEKSTIDAFHLFEKLFKVFCQPLITFCPRLSKRQRFYLFKKNLVLYLLYVSFLDLDRCSILFAPLDKVCTTRRSVAYFMTLIKLGTPANPPSNSRLFTQQNLIILLALTGALYVLFRHQ